MHADAPHGCRSSRIRTRLLSFVALGALASSLAWLGSQTYRAATDSFVAPIILSPDNDVVLANKVKLSELQIERMRDVAALEAIDLDIRATDELVEKLEDLLAKSKNTLAWTTTTTAQAAASGAAERRRIRNQRALLLRMRATQQRLVADARANVDSGLISQTDYVKEVQALEHVELALFDNEHSRIQSDFELSQVTLSQRSISTKGATVAMPEVILREEQMLRIELELVRMQSERRAKATEKTIIQQKLARIDELDAQFRARPIFRAIDQSMDVAFVPYTQIEGVENGGAVYDCVWGLVHCRVVGKVAEVLPGEVVLPDPWGNQARGQYAVLDLQAHDSAKSKTLRIRANTKGSTSSVISSLFAHAQKAIGG